MSQSHLTSQRQGDMTTLRSILIIIITLTQANAQTSTTSIETITLPTTTPSTINTTPKIIATTEPTSGPTQDPAAPTTIASDDASTPVLSSESTLTTTTGVDNPTTTTTPPLTDPLDPFVPSDLMDFDWLLREFCLQVAINLFCLLIIIIVLYIFFNFCVPQPQPAPPRPEVPEKFHYVEEELEQMKMDLESISRTYLLAKKMKRNNLNQDEILVVGEENTEETEAENTEETETENETPSIEPESGNDDKEPETIIDIE